MDELEENETSIPDENEPNDMSDNNINNGRPSDNLSPNNINFTPICKIQLKMRNTTMMGKNYK